MIIEVRLARHLSLEFVPFPATRILFAMSASDSEEIDMKTIKKSGIVQGTLAKSLVRLERKGLVHRCGYGKYRLSLPLLGEYLKRRISRCDATFALRHSERGGKAQIRYLSLGSCHLCHSLPSLP